MNEWISILLDHTPGLAALIAAAVAVRGLYVWKDQLRWKTEYELSRRLLRATYEVRDAIDLVRTPVIFSGEYTAAREEAGIEHDQYAIGTTPKEERAVYARRFKEITKALSNLDAEVLEAEVLWGERAPAIRREMRRCVAELNSAVRRYIRYLETPPKTEKDVETFERIERIIYRFEDDSDDPFQRRLDAVVKKMEALVRPHLNERRRPLPFPL